MSSIPKYGWSRKGSEEFSEFWTQNLRPKYSQVKSMLPMGFRYVFKHFIPKYLSGQKPPIDQIRMVTSQQGYGVPCGGIGSGTIGRGFCGEFTRFQIVPGVYSYHTVKADAFHVIIKNPQTNEIIFKSVLASKKSSNDKSLSSWEYNVLDENIHYHGLYPCSWTTYDITECKVKLTCQQISPFIPHNYDDSSLPVTVFEWSIDNYGDSDLLICLGFTFKNGWGSKNDKKLSPQTKDFNKNEFPDLCGRQMDQKFRDLRLSYAISVKNENGFKSSVLNDFNVLSDGSTLWNNDSEHFKGEEIAMGVCSEKIVSSSSSDSKIKFGLCWDMPKIKFRSGENIWTRKYYKSHKKISDEIDITAQNILQFAFDNCDKWKKAIEEWQEPILSDSQLPDWFKSAIFNELYYIADGGSQWLDYESQSNPYDPRAIFGRFAYLESHEYRLYNTYDVHFYASFALIGLFPGIQLSIQMDYCDATKNEDNSRVTDLGTGQSIPRNKPFYVPHDLGDPEDEPFSRVNAYVIHDVSNWKDLNLKFIISLWRDIVWCLNSQTNDLKKAAEFLLNQCWPICVEVMQKSEIWDKDNDGLIENDGIPDQTYDAWSMSGPSSYCNSLWIAAIACMKEFATKLSKTQAIEKYSTMLEKSKSAFDSQLWMEDRNFFRFDTSMIGGNTIMSDQLCGLWYLNFCQVNEEIFDKEKVSQALDTIYHFNVKIFGDKKLGAVNGMIFSKKKVDQSAIQSEEIWTGSTYALASLMIHQGKVEKGFNTAEGIYRTVYETIGLGFNTPEALYKEKKYRSIGYMRALSIWSIYESWKIHKKTN